MLNRQLIEKVLEAAVSFGGDFAEIFVESVHSNGIVLLGGKIENALSGTDYGVGIRIFDGFNSVYVYTNDDSEENLVKIAKRASQAVKANKNHTNIVLNEMKINNIHQIIQMPNQIENSEKVNLMKFAYEKMKNYDTVISQASVRYSENIQNVLIANTEGKLVEDERVRTRLMMQAVATDNGEMQVGYFAPGAHKGFELYNQLNIEQYAINAAEMAKTMLYAEECPSGKMPVIIENGFGGVIFHEACGHSLEATSVAKGTSVFTDKIGQKIASDVVTAIDDGTIPNAWGSQNVDDEGELCRKNVLIENGILKSYMIDKLNGRRMKMEATGSSRRQSYKYAPTSRMTNTFIAPGKSTLEEMLQGVEKGIYAKNMGGGSVNTTTGDFNFSVMEGYLIENGKITKPVRGATLIGTGAQVLQDIDMVGNNLEHGQGVCGSSSGSIPANVGQPALRVKSITVGGRKENE